MTVNYNARQHLIHLVNIIPEEKLHAALQIMESLVRESDPPLTDEERAESEENWQAILKDDCIPWDKAREDLANR